MERVVLLALRSEDRVECFWPGPLEPRVEVAPGAAMQLRVMANKGHAGSGEVASARVRPRASPEDCQRPTRVPGHAAVAEPWYVSWYV